MRVKRIVFAKSQERYLTGDAELTSKSVLFGSIVVAVISAIALLFYPPLYILIGLLILAGLGAIFLNPFFGLLCVIFAENTLFVIFTRAEESVITISGIRLIGLVLLIGWLWRLLILRQTIFVRSTQNLLILGIFCASVVANFFAIQMGTALLRYQTFFLLVILYLIVVDQVNTERRVGWVTWMIISASTLVALSSIQEYFVGGVVRAAGFVGQANRMGLIVLIAIPLAFNQLWVNPGAWKKAGILTLLFVLVLGVVASVSRGVFVAFLGMTPFLLWRIKRGRWKVAFFMALFIALVIPMIPQAYWDRIATIAERGGSETGRLGVWEACLRVFRDYPLGLGMDNFIIVSQSYSSPGSTAILLPRAPHNLYLQSLVDTGIFGLLFLLGLIWLTIRDLRRAASLFQGKGDEQMYNLISAFLVSFIAYLMSSFFSNNFYHKYMYFLFGLAVALRKMAEVKAGAIVDGMKAGSKLREKPVSNRLKGN